MPEQLPEERRKAIAIAAARAALDAKPEWSSTVIDLGKTFRKADRSPEATDLFRKHRLGAEKTVDYADNVRGYWYEWGVCEGALGGEAHRAADAWLQGLSLSDHLNPVPITEEQIKLSCSGLGVAFGKLATAAADCPYARARRAVAGLGRRVTLDPRSASYFDRYDHEAEALGTPRPRDLAEAVAWLAAGVAAAGKAVTDPFLARLAKPEKISFASLQAVLERRH